MRWGLETFFVIFKQCDPKNHRGVSHLLLVVQVKKVLICFEGQLNEVLMASGQWLTSNLCAGVFSFSSSSSDWLLLKTMTFWNSKFVNQEPSNLLCKFSLLKHINVMIMKIWRDFFFTFKLFNNLSSNKPIILESFHLFDS